MKHSFFKELNSFKKQLLEASEIDSTWLQSQTDSIDISSILEVLTKMWNDLKRPETTYYEQETTWNYL